MYVNFIVYIFLIFFIRSQSTVTVCERRRAVLASEWLTQLAAAGWLIVLREKRKLKFQDKVFQALNSDGMLRYGQR